MSFSMSSVLEKMKSRDKDFRYMATSDLIAELQSDTFNVDSISQKKLVAQVLDLVDDNSNDVQEIAAKCLGPLVKNVAEQHVLHIAQTLVGHLLNDDKKKDELRDISSIALKTVFGELNASDPATKNVVESLAKKLVSGIIADDNKTPAREQHLLEVLAVLLTRFGSLVGGREALQKALLPLLLSTRQATRKRTIDCLALLAVHESDELFNALIIHLLESAKTAKKTEHTRTMIQCFGAISRCVGYKLGPYLNQVVPVVIKYCDDSAFDNDEDLRENCLQCFETLIHRCPKDISTHIDAIEELALKYIKFDPNYAADSDDEGEGSAMEGDDDFGGDDEDADDGFDDDYGDAFDDEEFSDEMYSDDDDMSWKVRRACAKCLTAIVDTRPERVAGAYTSIAPKLVARFKEREENVKLDVFEAFRSLLRQTRRLMPRGTNVSTSTTAPDAGSSHSALDKALNEIVPSLVDGLAKQAKASSAKVRLGALTLARSLAAVASAKTLEAHAQPLSKSLAKSLIPNEKDGSNLRIEALILLRQLLNMSETSTYAPHLSELTPLVLQAAEDAYYRVSSEGLRTCAALVPTLRDSSGDERAELIKNVYTAVFGKLQMTDVDQDIKESAISCTGIVVAQLGDQLTDELPQCLTLLHERLCNEITRLPAVQAFEAIANSSLDISLGKVLGDTTSELARLLRQANRQLRQAALLALTSVARTYGSAKACHAIYKDVFAELVPLVTDADLHLAHLSLELARTMVETYSKCASTATEKLVPAILRLLSSSLLQGVALRSVRSVCSTLASDAKRAKKLVAELQSLCAEDAQLGGDTRITAASAAAAAACVAEVAVVSGDDLSTPLVADLLKELQGKAIGDARRVMDLFTIGALGRRIDLAGHKGLQKTLLGNFDGVEDVKQSAALALGSSAVGNMDALFPAVLAELTSSNKQYLLLSAVRETIVRVTELDNGSDTIAPFLEQLLPALFERASTSEEGSRTVVAECLGKLAMLSPAKLGPELDTLLGNDNEHTRATTVTAIKFAIVERSHAVDTALAPLMPKALDKLSDPVPDVRKAALLLFHFAAHCKPSLVAPLVLDYVQPLYGEAKIKPELIREVDLGPFKHKVDDGLELRKAAYECMYTLLASFGRVIPMAPFIASLVEALGDDYDIRMSAHLILTRVAAVRGANLLEGLDQLVEPLRTTLTTKARDGAVKQEVERVGELVRSAMRAVRAIQEIDGVESVVKFRQMVATTLLEGELSEQYKNVLEEDGGADALASSLTASQLAEF